VLNLLVLGLSLHLCLLWTGPLVQGANVDRAKVLSLPLFPTPLVRKRIPLSRALSDVAVQVRSGYVLFGAEIRLRNGEEPSVDVNLPTGSTLGGALRQILQQVPGYAFEAASEHMVEIYPAGAKGDPNDALNLKVDRFEFDREPDWIINDPGDTIPGLKAFLSRRTAGPPLPVEGWSHMVIGVEPKVTLHLRNVTVREILNALSEAEERYPAQWQPSGWLVTIQPNAAFMAEGEYSWRALLGVSDAWKHEAKARQQN
jgi:hypothetical protein